MVLVKPRSNVDRGSMRKRVFSQEIQHVLLSLEQPEDKMNEPGVVFIASERCKPYLPVKPRLVRGLKGTKQENTFHKNYTSSNCSYFGAFR